MGTDFTSYDQLPDGGTVYATLMYAHISLRDVDNVSLSVRLYGPAFAPNHITTLNNNIYELTTIPQIPKYDLHHSEDNKSHSGFIAVIARRV